MRTHTRTRTHTHVLTHTYTQTHTQVIKYNEEVGYSISITVSELESKYCEKRVFSLVLKDGSVEQCLMSPQVQGWV